MRIIVIEWLRMISLLSTVERSLSILEYDTFLINVFKMFA